MVTIMTTRLIELKGKPAKSLGNGVFEVKLLASGWGSSGYYSPELLRESGTATFKAGRPSFANHPTDEEFENGRDITKIMGRLITDAEVREDNALWAQMKVRPEWVDFVEEYKDTIGLSIFASGSLKEGEIEGRSGMIVESFDPDDPYTSVDFVVAAGAGGKVERMLESFKAKTNVTEALHSARRDQLSDLLKNAYGTENGYIWVRDIDESSNVVYFDVEEADSFKVYAQSFSLENDVATKLLDSRSEVRVETSYASVDSPRQTSENDNKEKVMTPEEMAEFATVVATAVAEALKPAPKDDEETPAASAATVAEAVIAANLPESARKRVFEALEKAPESDIAQVIESEKTYVDSVLAEAKVEVDEIGGRVYETGQPGPSLSVTGWSV